MKAIDIKLSSVVSTYAETLCIQSSLNQQQFTVNLFTNFRHKYKFS